MGDVYLNSATHSHERGQSVTATLAPSAPDEWLLLDDAALELGVSRKTLIRYAQAGKVLRLYHGGRAYTTRASIEQYKASEAQKAEAKRAAAEKQANRRRR